MKVKHISSENGHTYVIDLKGDLFYLDRDRAQPVTVQQNKPRISVVESEQYSDVEELT